MSILTIEHLYYSYDKGKTPVLKDINFEFEKGNSYAIVGKSGSGKTTLLSLISGLDNASSGKILYDEKDISKIDKFKYRSRNIGVIFQNFNLLFHLTALENVMLSMDIAGIKVDNPKKHALDILSKVNIDEAKANRRILKLSGGEQQRVAIARALSYNPDVILADEPTGNLDSETEEDVIKILNSLSKDDNKCVIIVTHSKKVSQSVDIVYKIENN